LENLESSDTLTLGCARMGAPPAARKTTTTRSLSSVDATAAAAAAGEAGAAAMAAGVAAGGAAGVGASSVSVSVWVDVLRARGGDRFCGRERALDGGVVLLRGGRVVVALMIVIVCLCVCVKRLEWKSDAT
jgi:hypothetical protein